MLLDVDHEIDARVHGGCTALHLAAWMGEENVVRLLVEVGANVNAKRDDKATAWDLAAAANHENVQQLLLEHGAEKGKFQYLDTAGKDDDSCHCDSDN